MNQLTIGQRIASRRKLLNLSQEALAEQLSVSRQAVSKWESDAAIPEVDKLIALCKLFDVSIGWLLGVESGAGFNEEQLQVMEQLIRKYQPPKKRIWWRLTAIVCALAIFIAAFTYLGQSITLLGERNEGLFEEISALNGENNTLKQQITDLNNLIVGQLEGEKLINDVFFRGFTDTKLEKVSMTCYMTPRFDLGNKRAFLQVENPSTGYDELFACTWSEHHNWYIAQFDCPIADGYKWTFVLMHEYSRLEADAMVFKDRGIEHIGTYCQFHIAPESPEFARLQRLEPVLMPVDTAIYAYNEGIYTPYIFAKTTVAYKHITLSLMLNDHVIWQGDYLNAFKSNFDVPSISTRDNPVYPNVSVKLSELKAGDEIKLILTAETVNGGAPTQSYETLLDYRIVTE